jgi:hypothetical protein
MSGVHGGAPPWANDALGVNAVGGFGHGRSRSRKGEAPGQRGERVAGFAACERAAQQNDRAGQRAVVTLGNAGRAASFRTPAAELVSADR